MTHPTSPRPAMPNSDTERSDTRTSIDLPGVGAYPAGAGQQNR